MANIFISHSSKDNEKTKDIFNTLQEIGNSLFLDFDGKHGLKGGNKWEKELYVRVKKARIMIVALSPNWLNSQWCYKEYCMARVLRKKIIPVVITADNRIFSWDGNDIQHFDTTKDDNAIEQLKERIAELTRHDISKIYDIKKIDAPFVGLRSFNKEEAGIFYGRNNEILDGIDKLNGMASSENQKFLNIIGASGVGKSSFLKAGILPLLELLYQDDWYVLPTFRAKQELLLNLGKTFSFANGSKELLSQENTKDFFDAMEEQIYKECKSQNRKIEELKILFPIDQAEEILSSTNTQEKEQFFKILQTLLEEKSNFFVVWTLRSDHLKKYQDEALLEFLHQQDETLLLQPIASKELKNIIQEPAYTADVHIEEAVVEEIKEDIRSSTSLPLLAHLLQTLYSKTKSKEKKQITLNDYKALSSEGRNPIENIINEQAEKIYKNINEESLVQELFLNHLIKVNSDESVIKQSANLNAIPLKQQAIAEQFVAKRLFVKDGDGSEVATIEIAHEALISSWERFLRWIDEEKEFLIWKLQFDIAFDEWEKTEKSKKAFLRGLQLEKSLGWRSKLDSQEVAFINKSYIFEQKEKHRKWWMTGSVFLFSLLLVLAKNNYEEKTKDDFFFQINKEQIEDEKKSLEIERLSNFNNKLLVWSHYKIFLWERKNFKVPRLTLDHKETIQGAFVTTNKILSWGQKYIRLWSLKTGEELFVLIHKGVAENESNFDYMLDFSIGVIGVLLSKSEKIILSWTRNKVYIWDLNHIDKPKYIFDNFDSIFSEIYKVLLSEDEKYILVLSSQRLELLNSETYHSIFHIDNYNLKGAFFSKDSKKIISYYNDGHFKETIIEENMTSEDLNLSY